MLHTFADTPRGGYGKDVAAVDLHCISEVALVEIKPSRGHLGGFTGVVCHTLAEFDIAYYHITLTISVISLYG